jgi:hypothetical protein
MVILLEIINIYSRSYNKQQYTAKFGLNLNEKVDKLSSISSWQYRNILKKSNLNVEQIYFNIDNTEEWLILTFLSGYMDEKKISFKNSCKVTQ